MQKRSEPLGSAVRVRLCSARVCGAIAILELVASDESSLDSVLSGMGIESIGPGRFVHRRFGQIDAGVVVRQSATCCMLMPHASPLIVQRLFDSALSCGAMQDDESIGRERFSECADEIEGCVLAALADSVSPIAIDAILVHEVRWRAAGKVERLAATDHLCVLRDPPRVVLVGRPNVGKSSLTNAMAGRAVSVVSDEAGTTRDHIGVLLECDGLVVQWLDTAGLEEAGVPHCLPGSDDSILDGADLVVHCSDQSGRGFTDLSFPQGSTVLRCGTKADLGEVPGAEVWTSVQEKRGLGELARAVRRCLAPAERIFSGPLWRFHPRLPV